MTTLKATRPSTTMPSTTTTTEETTRRGRKPSVKTNFLDTPEARPFLDDQGRLNASPISAYDSTKFKKLKRGDFAEEYIATLFRADLFEQTATKYAEKARRLRSDAEAEKNQPNSAARKQVRRMQRLREQLAAIEAKLAEEGIQIDPS